MSFKLDSNQPYMSRDEKLFKIQECSGIWIYKPSNQNCGRGIIIIDDFRVIYIKLVIQKRLFL